MHCDYNKYMLFLSLSLTVCTAILIYYVFKVIPVYLDWIDLR